ARLQRRHRRSSCRFVFNMRSPDENATPRSDCIATATSNRCARRSHSLPVVSAVRGRHVCTNGGSPMLVRMRAIKKLTAHDYRLTADVVDPEREPWHYGDCVVQVDLHDGLAQHISRGRGLVAPAIELYRLSPDDPPQGSEALLLWEIGQVIHRYVDRI